MKDRFNESLKVVNLLIKGEISSLCFYKVKYDEDDCLKDDRVVEVMNYLDGLGHYFKLEDYKSKKFGDGLKLTLVKDGEWIDAQQEYLNCQALFGDFSKEEEKLLHKVSKMNVKEYFSYMTPKQINSIRWDLMYYLTNNEHIKYEVHTKDGFVVISK